MTSIAAAEVAGGPPAALADYLEIHSAYHRIPPPLMSQEEITALDAGDVVTLLLASDDDTAESDKLGMGVLGLVIVDAPRLLVWLSLVRDSEEVDGRVTRAVIARDNSGLTVRYQHINLPWPVQDRHWVIQVQNNLDVVDASGSSVWERNWALHDRGTELLQTAFSDGTIQGLTRKSFDKSIYLPKNSGYWSVARLGENRTLVAAHVNVLLGGRIPRGLVWRFAQRNLRSGLESLNALVEKTVESIDIDTLPVDGRGRQISAEDFERSRRQWRPRLRPAN